MIVRVLGIPRLFGAPIDNGMAKSDAVLGLSKRHGGKNQKKRSSYVWRLGQLFFLFTTMSDPLAHVRLMTMLNVKATHPRKEDENMPKKRVRTSVPPHAAPVRNERPETPTKTEPDEPVAPCLLYTSDAADDVYQV